MWPFFSSTFSWLVHKNRHIRPKWVTTVTSSNQNLRKDSLIDHICSRHFSYTTILWGHICFKLSESLRLSRLLSGKAYFLNKCKSLYLIPRTNCEMRGLILESCLPASTYTVAAHICLYSYIIIFSIIHMYIHRDISNTCLNLLYSLPHIISTLLPLLTFLLSIVVLESFSFFPLTLFSYLHVCLLNTIKDWDKWWTLKLWYFSFTFITILFITFLWFSIPSTEKGIHSARSRPQLMLVLNSLSSVCTAQDPSSENVTSHTKCVFPQQST